MTSKIGVEDLSKGVKAFVKHNAAHMCPRNVYVCDGSEEEDQAFREQLVQEGRAAWLTKYNNCVIVRTKKEDVARVEKCTFTCSKVKAEAVPEPKPGVKSKLGNWKDTDQADAELEEKYRGCMKGRTMFVIPFCMGTVTSPFRKYGVQLTDSMYVVCCMKIMTRMGKKVLDSLGDGEFTKCLHSVGMPLEPGQKDELWPCNPGNILICQFPERNEIKSYGSGYGGNSLLGKKCFALRIASTLARKEGWLAEHMLILGITNPQGVKKYICGAFPSQCGKTNLAMITPTLPGWKAECVGDDIAWLRFGPDGRLWACNPENGLFGVASGTNNKSNPNAMKTILENTVFTNVASTSDGGFYWEGLEHETPKDVSITSWLKEENWNRDMRTGPAAHPNSRFCAPTYQVPHLDARWEDPKGVPIDAILFGGRRPVTIPLVFEAYSWKHAVFVALCMRSQATAAAADHKGKKILLNDPFAMRPFFGYNFSRYMDHWLSLRKKPDVKLPRVFHVNWFRENEKGEFIWPGFGENCRVLEYILRRCDGEDIAVETPIGLIPKPGMINTEGLGDVDMEHLFDMSKEELETEVKEMEAYFDEQLPGQLPKEILGELEAFKERIAKM